MKGDTGIGSVLILVTPRWMAPCSQSVSSPTIGMEPGAEQQPHLRMVGALRCLFLGGLSQCRKWRASAASGSICLASLRISMSVGVGQHCPRRSQSLFQHFSQLLFATSIQSSSIQCSLPWALRPMGLITMYSTGLALIFSGAPRLTCNLPPPLTRTLVLQSPMTW